ncbi:MAG: fluoride efflux transporter CrcB [Sciscionella sp.]
MSILLWIGVALIGGAGATARFLLDGVIMRRSASGLPIGTYVVNITGALLLGFVAGLALPTDGALLGGTAAIGSYTTFSTWMLETHRLGEERQVVGAAANVIFSVVAGVAAAALGKLAGVAL